MYLGVDFCHVFTAKNKNKLLVVIWCFEYDCVTGLHVVYNLNSTAGSRVVMVEVLCADCEVPEYFPLELNKTYGVVLPQYLSNGGDNFTMFKGYTSQILGKFNFLFYCTIYHCYPFELI